MPSYQVSVCPMVGAGCLLKNKYVLMRNSSGEIEEEGEKRLTIPITMRQQEAVVRITESLAQMELQPFALN